MPTYINVARMAEKLGLTEDQVLEALVGHTCKPDDDFDLVRENCQRSMEERTLSTIQDFAYAAAWFLERDATAEGSKAYFVGTHRYHFQAGTPAEILGVEVITVGDKQRPCFRLRFPDGRVDHAPLIDEDFVGKGGLGVSYEIISDEQVMAGLIPVVTS